MTSNSHRDRIKKKLAPVDRDDFDECIDALKNQSVHTKEQLNDAFSNSSVNRDCEEKLTKKMGLTRKQILKCLQNE